ncbi:MAG: DUF4253 domain-containing protein [Acutalibacteraceae bacterium]
MKITIVIDHFDMFSFAIKQSLITNKGDQYFCDETYDIHREDEKISVNIPAEHSCEIFRMIGNYWGGWNDCPDNITMYNKASEWEKKYKAQIVEISHDSVVFKIDKNVSEELRTNLLEEVKTFAPNSMDIAEERIIRKRLFEENTVTLWWD